MQATDITRRALRNLWQSKSRTFLTAGAIAIGAFSLAITIALGTSLDLLTQRLISQNANKNDLSISAYVEDQGSGAMQDTTPKEFDPNKRLGEFGAFGPPATITNKDIEDIRAIPGVVSIDRGADSAIPARYIKLPEGKKFELSAVSRFNTESPPSLVTSTLSDISAGQVVMQEQYLSVLGFSDAAAASGKKVVIGLELPDTSYTEEEFTIAGVAEEPNGIFSIFTANSAFIARSEVDRVYDLVKAGSDDYNEFYAVTARVADGANVADVQKAIADLGNGKRFEVSSAIEFSEDASGVIRVIQIALGGFAAIVLFAALFGVVNTQLMSVLQRTREIGLMKALGMSSGAVSRLFLIEAALIGLLGGLLGTLVAWLVANAIDPLARNLIKEIISVNQVIFFNWNQVLLMLLGLMVIAALAGLLPARRAAKLDPIEALRTE